MLRKLLLVTSFVALIFGLQGCETAPEQMAGVKAESAPAAILKSPKDTRQFATLTLANEMEVLLVQDTSSDISAVSLALGVGSFQNPANQQGLAHYLEHMLFLGTEKYPEPNTLQKFIDHNSGSWNAYTAADHTNYFFSLPAEKLDEALDMFSDYFKAPLFDLEYSDKERNAVNSEWSMGRSQDGRIIHYLSGITGNPQHPASQLAVGNLETLADKEGSILNEELVSFFNRYYSSNIMKLVMVSKLPLDQQEALARKHFGGVENKYIEKPSVKVPGVTATEMGKKIHYKSVMDLKMLVLSFPIPNNLDQWKSKPNNYIVSLLASEEPGTVAQQLREKNLAKAVYARVNPSANDYDGNFEIYAELTDEGMTKRDEIIASLFAYVDLIRKHGVDEKYFLEQQAINQKKFANMEMQQPLQTAIGLSATLLTFEPQWAIAHPYVYEKFDRKAVRNVLKQLEPERARIWYISQTESATTPVPFHEGAYDVQAVEAADIKRWKALAASIQYQLPAENDLFSKSAVKVLPSTLEKPKLLKDTDGVEVWLTHSKQFQGQKGKIDILLNTPMSSANAKNQMLAKLFASAMNSQQLSLVDRAGQAGIGIQFLFNKTDFVVSLSEFNAKHPLLVERIFTELADWSISDAEFAKAKDSLRQNLINREKSPPIRQLGDLLGRQLMENSWSREEEKTVVDGLTKQELLDYKGRLFTHNRLRVFAYGNYDESTVLKIAADVEGRLPVKRKSSELYVRKPMDPVAGRNIVYKEALTGHTDNALLQQFSVAEKSILSKAQLVTLDALLGNSFFTQLRTNEQLGYVVGTAASTDGDFAGLLFYVQSNNKDLPAIKTRIERFQKEFLSELEATAPEVIEQIKTSQLALLNKLPSDYHEEMGPLLSDFYGGRLDFDSKEKLKAEFPHVTKEAIVALYKSLVLNAGGRNAVVQLKGSSFADTEFASD